MPVGLHEMPNMRYAEPMRPTGHLIGLHFASRAFGKIFTTTKKQPYGMHLFFMENYSVGAAVAGNQVKNSACAVDIIACGVDRH